MPPKKTLKQLAIEKKKQSAVKHKDKPIKTKRKTFVGEVKYDVVNQPKVVRWVDDRPTDILKSADKTNKSFLIQQGPQGVRLVADPTKPESYRTSKVLIEQVGTIDPKVVTKGEAKPVFKPIAPTPKPVTPGAKGIEAVQYMIFEKDKSRYMPNPVSDSQRLLMNRPFKPYNATELLNYNDRYDFLINGLKANKTFPQRKLWDGLAMKFANSKATKRQIVDLANVRHPDKSFMYTLDSIVNHLIDGTALKITIPNAPELPPPPLPTGPIRAPGKKPDLPPEKKFMTKNRADSFVSGKYLSTQRTKKFLDENKIYAVRDPIPFNDVLLKLHNDAYSAVVEAMGGDINNSKGTKAEKEHRNRVAEKFADFTRLTEKVQPITMFETLSKEVDADGTPLYKPEDIVDHIVDGSSLTGSGISESMANKLVGLKPVKMPKPFKPKLTGSGQPEQVLQPEQVYPVHHPTAEEVQRNNIRRYLMEIKSSKPSDVPEYIRVEGYRNPVVSREYTTQDDSVLLGERIRSSTHEINKAKAAGKSIIASPAYYVPFVVSV